MFICYVDEGDGDVEENWRDLIECFVVMIVYSYEVYNIDEDWCVEVFLKVRVVYCVGYIWG